MKAFICSNGCPESLIDTNRVAGYLKLNCWVIEDDLSKANLILFFACGFSEQVTNQSCRTIEKLRKNAPKNAQVIVWGCLPKIDPEKLSQVYNGETFDERNLDKLEKLFSYSCNTFKFLNPISAYNIL